MMFLVDKMSENPETGEISYQGNVFKLNVFSTNK